MWSNEKIKNVLFIVLNSVEIREKNLLGTKHSWDIGTPIWPSDLESLALPAELINRAEASIV